MNNCFMSCISLVYLNIENWVINERCNTKDMFLGCDNLSLIKCTEKTFERLFGELGDGWIYEDGFGMKC